MKIPELEFADKLNNIKLLLVSYENGLKLLGEFILDPLTTANKITTIEEISIRETFLEVIKGLTGEFTKAQAVEVGKQHIVNYLTMIKDDIKNNFANVDDILNYPVKVLNDTITILSNTTDAERLLVRKDAYLSNEITVQYMNQKLLNIMIPFSEKTPSVAGDLGKYMFRLKQLLSRLGTVDNTEVIKAIETYKANKEYLKVTCSRISGGTFIPEEFNTTNEFLKEIPELLSVMELKLSNTTEPTEAVDPLSLLPGTIAELISAGKRLEMLNKVFENDVKLITQESDDFILLLETMHTEVALAYAGLQITTEKFNYLSFSYLNCLNNYIISDGNVMAVISNKAIEIKLNILLYQMVYNIIDKVTLEGTLDKKLTVNE